MRVSDRATNRSYLKYMNKAKADYAKVNEQIASGNRFQTISDDVSAGTRALRIRMDLDRTNKQLENVKTIAEEFKTTEDTMLAMNDILKDVHGLALKAANGDKRQNTETLANEIKNLKEHLIYLANTKYGKKFVFGGSNASASAPFKAGADGKLQYNGIDIDSIKKDADGYYYEKNGNRQNIPMNEDVYMDIGLGTKTNAENSGFLISHSGLEILGFGEDDEALSNNIYNILNDLEENIRNYDSDAIGKLDTKLTSITDKFRGNLTNIGSKTKYLDTMKDRLSGNVDSYKTQISNLVGTNDTEAATTQAMNDYVLKAVIQMGSRILPISLMDFLR